MRMELARTRDGDAKGVSEGREEGRMGMVEADEGEEKEGLESSGEEVSSSSGEGNRE